MFRLAPLLLGAVGISCIDRSNPFDPLNLGPQAAAEVRVENRAGLDSLTGAAAAFAIHAKEYTGLFSADSVANDSILKGNSSVRADNDRTREHNLSVAESNRIQVVVDSMKLKAGFAFLDTLRPYGPYPEFQVRLTGLQLQAAALAVFIASVNGKKVPLVVYNSAFIDSVFTPYRRDSLAYARIHAGIESGNAAVAAANADLKAYNAIREDDNRAVAVYNDSIDFIKKTQNKNIIVRADSLQALTFVAKAGDSLYLGAGSFNVDLRFTNSGTVDSPIVLRGSPGMTTILKGVDKNGTLNGSVGILSNRANIRFEGIVFRMGGVSGMKVESGSRNISFRNCRFDSSGQWGVEAIDSDLEMIDCRVLGNGGGIRTTSTPNSDLRIRLVNNLVAGNRGHGLEAVSPMGEVSNCTFSDNTGEGIRVNSPLRALTIANSIVSSNLGTGIFREATSLNQDGFIVKECDIWGNREADWNLLNMDSTRAENLKKANLNVKPEFIDPSSFNYALKPGSVLADYEARTLPVVIGYRP
ncbi:MAG: right-handed parallel beta-helix repeat-containing protein [Fibrobacterota bacterium]|nr:right-handed parallel beta-helix repeat-containing protein [Fibrobacterota bacterium]